MRKLYLSIYLISTFGIILRAMMNGQDIVAYYDFTSLSIVAIPTVMTFLLANQKCIQTALSSSMFAAAISGLFGAALGTALTLGNSFNSEVGDIAVGLGMSMLPVIYSLVILMFLFPVYIYKKYD